MLLFFLSTHVKHNDARVSLVYNLHDCTCSIPTIYGTSESGINRHPLLDHWHVFSHLGHSVEISSKKSLKVRRAVNRRTDNTMEKRQKTKDKRQKTKDKRQKTKDKRQKDKQ